MSSIAIDRFAFVLWWMTAFTGAAGLGVWIVKLSQPAVPRGLPSPPEVEIDLDSFVACPPLPGPPTPLDLEVAIEKGRNAFVEKYVRPYQELALQGGFLDYTDAAGVTRRLGPEVYFQNQLYTLVHFLMYFRELGFEPDDPLVRELREWLLSKLDQRSGRWLWSEEGCLQPKMMVALSHFGERELIDLAYEWARSALFFRREDGLFSIMQSGFIIQTLGPSDRSLSNQLVWEHKDDQGEPVNAPDEENSAKYLYALLAAGHSADSEEVVRLHTALSTFLAHTPLAVGHWRTHHIVGRCWLVLCHQKFDLPPTDGYVMSLKALRQAGEGEWRYNLMMRTVPLFRALMVRVLLLAGERGEELDSIVHGLVAGQDPDGSWTLPHTYKMWNMDRPPKVGYKYGNFDSSNTYKILLTLLAYRDLVMNS